MAEHPTNHTGISRRQFNKTVAGLGAAALASAAPTALGQSDRTIRAAWIGTGSRGSGDVRDFLIGCDNVELVALADVLADKQAAARQMLGKLDKTTRQKVKITDSDCYLGFDAYQKVMDRDDVDLVLLTTPPAFRPQQVTAAVEAGKHIFFEKPAAVDTTGVRTIMQAGEKARQKGLAIAVGTQQRYMNQYRELMQRIRDGQIGKVVAAQVFWHWDSRNWHFHERQDSWSDMEWQIRCWPYFTWLSGDHVVEQHVHNLDTARWLLGDPTSVIARGGRQARTGEKYGNIYDHFSADFEYDNGVHVASYASQIRGASGLVGTRFLGSKGQAWVNRSGAQIKGSKPWTFSGPNPDAEQRLFQTLVDSIRKEQPINEAAEIAKSTLMGIMARMGAYTGRQLQWDWALHGSKEQLMWPEEKLDINASLPVRPVAIPGETKLQ
jgi:predicted dehydrogenase